jgi:ABC-type antimicrobial peptide transport system permease subunit
VADAVIERDRGRQTDQFNFLLMFGPDGGRAFADVVRELAVVFGQRHRRFVGTGPVKNVLGYLSQIAGGIALIFSMIGLFSLMSFIVARRTVEIGIRMSLGAQRRDVLFSVMRETLSLVLIGVIIGVCFAFELTPVMNTEFLGLSPHDPTTIVAVIMLTLIVAAVAGYLPARRASKVDPLIALRYE